MMPWSTSQFDEAKDLRGIASQHRSICFAAISESSDGAIRFEIAPGEYCPPERNFHRDRLPPTGDKTLMGRSEKMSRIEPRIIRRIVWRQILSNASWEFAELERGTSGARLSGRIVAVSDNRPAFADYELDCSDDLSRCRSVRLNVIAGGEARSLSLDHDPVRGWFKNGASAPDLSLCTDPDLSWSPSTNAFPLTRLPAAAGAVLEIRAAWIRMPSLNVEIARQSYERLADGSARYRNERSGNEAIITFDEIGLPLTYAGVWQRSADWSAP
jgi:hypothetical protein